MRTIRIGFLGLGEHQIRAHLKHLVMLAAEGAPIEFVAAYDPRDAAFHEVKAHLALDLERAPSAEALLNRGAIDAVFISSPDKFHGEHLRMAASVGLHIFCEKPMAVTSQDMRDLHFALDEGRKYLRVVTTCHPRRFDPPFVWLKNELLRLVEQYGAVQHFDFMFHYHEVTDEWKKDRSLLSDHFGHEIDIFRFLFGDLTFEATKRHDSYAAYAVDARVLRGPSFRFSGYRSLAESVYKESVTLDFERARIHLYLNEGKGLVLPEGHTFEFPAIDYDVRFRAVNRNFIGSILGQENRYLTADDLVCNDRASVGLTEEGTHTWMSRQA